MYAAPVVVKCFSVVLFQGKSTARIRRTAWLKRTGCRRQLHVKVSHIWVQNCGIKYLIVYTYIITIL